MRLKRDGPCFQAEIGPFAGIDCGSIVWTVWFSAAPRCIRGDSSIVGVYMTSNEEREITRQKIRPPAIDPNPSRGISITNRFSKVLNTNPTFSRSKPPSLGSRTLTSPN